MLGKKKKEFVFEEEVQDYEDQTETVEAKPARTSVGKASSTRVLLLLLLLVVAGGGYFFTMSEPESPPPPPPVVQRQAIPIVKPQPAPAADPAMMAPAADVATTAAADVATTAAADVATTAAADVATTAVAAPPAAPAESAPAPVASVAAPSPAAQTPVATNAPAEKPSLKSVAFEPAPTVVPTAAPAKKPAAEAGKFTLVTVAYADKGNITTAQRAVRNLGFQPRVTTVKQETTMTRLHYGTFLPEEAPVRLKELKQVAPGAFTLPQGELISVYAGSFAVRDKARIFADALYQQQILVQEEVVKVKVPLQQVTFGSFAERGAANQAAAKARAAGLQVTVQARR